jgi:hypothetical protein
MKCFVYKGQMYEYAGECNGHVMGMIADPFAKIQPDTYVSIPVKDVMLLEVDTTPERNKDKIQKFQEIVDNQSAQEIDNVFVDLFTASCVMTIYNALNEENKTKLKSLSIEDICTQSLKLARKLQL